MRTQTNVMSPEANFDIKRSKTKDWSIRSAASIALISSSVLGSPERVEEPNQYSSSEHVLFIEGVPNLVPEIYLTNSPKSGPEIPHKDIESFYEVQTDFEMAVAEAIRLQAEEEVRLQEEQRKKLLAPARSSQVQAAGLGKIQNDGTDVWTILADCESGDGQVGAPYYVNWSYNGPSGFDGAFQFLPSTWSSLNAASGYEFAWQAPPEVQIAAAVELQARGGWGQWPGCTSKMRAKGIIE